MQAGTGRHVNDFRRIVYATAGLKTRRPTRSRALRSRSQPASRQPKWGRRHRPESCRIRSAPQPFPHPRSHRLRRGMHGRENASGKFAKWDRSTTGRPMHDTTSYIRCGACRYAGRLIAGSIPYPAAARTLLLRLVLPVEAHQAGVHIIHASQQPNASGVDHPLEIGAALRNLIHGDQDIRIRHRLHKGGIER